MTFLNPLVLFGLLAGTIPILLHIFNLRKLKTIEFSTLTFLKELQKTKIRRLKIRQILLLILRTLLVVLLVIAFSRPTLKGSFYEGLGAQAKTAVVFVIDDSYSMTSTDEQGELLKQAKQLASQSTDLLRDGDEVFLVKLSEASAVLSYEHMIPMRSFAALRSAIAEIRPSYVHRKLGDALRVSAKLLAASKNFNKEVYLFSDFQSGIVEDVSRGVTSSERLFLPEVRFFFVPLGNRELRNVSVDAVAIPNTIFEPNKPFSVNARITNHSPNEITNALVSVLTTGIRVAQKGVTIPRGSWAEVMLSVVPKSPGFIEGSVTLEDDDLEFDNRGYFTVTIPQELNVLLVGNPQDLHYIKLALATRSISDSSSLRIFEAAAERMAGNQVSVADVIVLSNVKGLSATQVDRLRSFVTLGGGLIIFPGSATTPQSFNSTFASPLRLPSLAGVEGTSQTQSQSFLEFKETDLRHPIFAGMFEEEVALPKGRDTKQAQKALESAKVKAYARFIVNTQSLPVITLSNGDPFLLEQRVGAGRVLLVCVAANLEWSDFPVKGLFVPLLHRSLSYLAQEQSKTDPPLIGSQVVLKNIRGPAATFTLQDPQNNEFSIQPTLRGSEKTIRIPETFFPGFYVVKSGNEIIRKFAVNIDPDESRTAKADQKTLATLLTRIGIESSSVHTIRNAVELTRTVAESRYGVELWKHFLLAALLVAIVEMLIARDSKKELAEFAPQTTS